MATHRCQLLFVFLSLFVFVQTGTSLRCYVCTSKREDCRDPFNNSTHTPDVCDLPTSLCLKQVIPALGTIKEGIHRGCVAEDYCNLFANMSKHCSTCGTDLCNTSAKTSASSYGILTSLCFYYLYRFTIR